ncbi:hypothetical protein [Nocardia vinacea]|uniref:hypothetical protein n=1 Tax=Nocardia vinacea TaxID=96468 RepID=UPI003F4CCF8A
MILIPSLLVLLGKWAWWMPAWPDKIVLISRWKGIRVAPNCAGSRRPTRRDSRYGRLSFEFGTLPLEFADNHSNSDGRPGITGWAAGGYTPRPSGSHPCS